MLGVSPGASRDEIQLAYVLRRREVQASGEYTEGELRRAYDALTGSGRREAAAAGYTASARAAERGGQARRSSVSGVALLVALLGILVIVMAFYVWPAYGYRLRSFRPDDQLKEAATGRPYGTVLEARKDHVFPNGRVGPAYRLRLEPDGVEVWYPASDVQYLCVRR